MGTATYVINWEELSDKLKEDFLKNIKEKIDPKTNLGMTKNELESWLWDMLDKLPNIHYKKLKNKIKEFILFRADGKQRCYGKLLDVPPLIQNNIQVFKFNKDILLTGAHFNQDGWHKEDRWSLIAGKINLINNASIKELGEHKYFNTYYSVKANTPIFFILHNNSGNSRHSLIDLDFIEGNLKEDIPLPPPPIPTPTPAIPDKPDIDAIKHNWDVAVRMTWEDGTDADIDLHVFMDTQLNRNSKHVCFWRKQEEGMWLDFDWLEHITQSNSEIVTVEGHKNKKIFVFIHDFNGRKLHKLVNVQIIKNLGNNKSEIIKEYNIKILQDARFLHGVCIVDLKTLKVIDLDKKLEAIYAQ